MIHWEVMDRAPRTGDDARYRLAKRLVKVVRERLAGGEAQPVAAALEGDALVVVTSNTRQRAGGLAWPVLHVFDAIMHRLGEDIPSTIGADTDRLEAPFEGAVHELKTWPEPFAAVRSGAKRHEIRKADRPFKVGDILVLEEFDPCGACPNACGTVPNDGKVLPLVEERMPPCQGHSPYERCLSCDGPPHSLPCPTCKGVGGVYTGEKERVRITFRSESGSWGLPDDVCVLSIERVMP